MSVGQNMNYEATVLQLYFQKKISNVPNLNTKIIELVKVLECEYIYP
jgi:hypothetical protein